MAGMEVDDGSNRVGGKRNFPGSRTFGPRIPQVCRFWQEGRCLKGDACQWQHPVAPETSGRFSGSSEPLGYKKSNYSIDNRAGAHVASIGTNGSGGQRRWGRKQQLQNLGEKVPFDSKRPLRDTVCLYWIRGNCNRGNNCNFLHSYTTASDFDIMTKLKGHEKVFSPCPPIVFRYFFFSFLFLISSFYLLIIWESFFVLLSSCMRPHSIQRNRTFSILNKSCNPSWNEL
ncbi:hypothetical protein O6H91_Y291200 [Diphasiastrum complanatum]|nr:hypothetical protein O6H91_Y291200 [Diphasiastrum complanatum]